MQWNRLVLNNNYRHQKLEKLKINLNTQPFSFTSFRSHYNIKWEINRFLFETGTDLVQIDASSEANMANAPAVASLTLLVSATVRGRNHLLTGQY